MRLNVMVCSLILFAILLTSCSSPTPNPAPLDLPATQESTSVAATSAPKVLTSTPATVVTQEISGNTTIEPENVTNLKQSSQISINNPGKLSWSSDSQVVGVQTQEGLQEYDVITLNQVANVVVQQPITLLDFSADSRTMAVTSDQTEIEIRNIMTGEIIRTIKPGNTFFNAQFTPDGRILAVFSSDEISVGLWNMENGEQVSNLKGFVTGSPVYNGTFSQDGRFFIWMSRNLIQSQEVSSTEMGKQLEHEDVVNSTALSLDGRFIAAGTAGTVNGQISPIVDLWNPSSGQSLGILLTGTDIVHSVAFSPDGRLLAAGAGQSIYLWDVATHQQLIKLNDHTQVLNSILFSPDGKTLASSSADGTVRFWSVAP